MPKEVSHNVNPLNSHEKQAMLRIGDLNSYFEVAPSQGGRVTNLVIENIPIITEPDGIDYADSYAASVLFPFPNRIEDGVYNYNHVDYVLPCNQTKEHNALHGLIYNQTFVVVERIQNGETAQVKLDYVSDGSFEGFPFKFKVELTYKLCNNEFSCQIKVTNTNEFAFPFALGWHPYFFTSETSKTTLHFKSKNQLINNHRNIPVEVKPCLEDVSLKFNQSYDDCFELATQEVEFKTPDYTMVLEVGEASNYLQIYTPEGKNVIAIEPMTAPANSFNNSLGLQILEPGASHTETWILKIVKPTLN